MSIVLFIYQLSFNLTMRRTSFFNNLLKSKRWYSSEGTAEKLITKEIKSADGTSIIEKINIIHRFTNMSKRTKILLGVYTGCVTGSFFLATYNDGKKELLSAREETKESTSSTIQKNKTDPEWRRKQDWDAVTKGCSRHMGSNFWNSLFFPFTWVTDAMPSVVLLFNPDRTAQELAKKLAEEKALAVKAVKEAAERLAREEAEKKIVMEKALKDAAERKALADKLAAEKKVGDSVEKKD